LRCSVGKIAAGIDVRANGGYIMWWPANGLPVLSGSPVALWPGWLPAQLLSPPRPTTQRITVPDRDLLRRLAQMIVGANAGKRNTITYWAACRAGEMVASGLLGADAAVALIVEAATRAGLPRPEAERTARSGIRRTGRLSHA
jgi:hypothetical protein